jgi:putative oxidoreductase
MMQSNPWSLRRAVIWIGRLVLGPIFAYAGISKLIYPNTHLWPWFVLKFSVVMNLGSFATQVESYKILAPQTSSLVAHTLPFAEIALGLLLLIGWRLRIGASLVTALMLGFFFAVTRAYVLHMDINCGCFGTPEKLTGWTIVRDGALAVLAVCTMVLAFIEARQPHPWSAPEASDAAPEKAPA